MQEPVPGISAVPDDGNARYFHVVVAGPEGSPFEGGVFKLELFLPEDYPMSAPKVGHHFCTHTSEHFPALPSTCQQCGERSAPEEVFTRKERQEEEAWAAAGASEKV